MWIGQAVSCHTLRQMEYDADHHAARIVGSQTFALTSRRMNALMIGQQIGQHSAQVMWMEKLLPNKLARLTCEKTKTIEDEQLDQFIKEQATEAKAHLFDTHPTDEERTKSVTKLQLDGVFRLEGKSIQLVEKADQYDQQVTKIFYEEECGFDLKTCQILNDEQIDKRLKNEQVRSKSMKTWYHNAIGMLCPIPVEAWKFYEFTSKEFSLTEINALDEQIKPQLKNLDEQLEKLNEFNTHYISAHIVMDCLSVGIKLDSGAFDMSDPTSAGAINLRNEAH